MTIHRRSLMILGLVALLGVTSVGAVFGGQADWKRDWEDTLAAARKEGQVNVYIYRYERLLADFKKDFPGINVVSVTGRGNELTTRLMTERRAGKYIADVYSGGTGGNFNVLYKGKALDPIKPALILPEVVDESKWYGKEHRYAEAEGKYVFAYLASPSDAQLAFNSTLVNPKEFKSYWDVTHLKWKGKIVSLDPRDGGLGGTMQFFFYNQEIGPEFIKKFFTTMDIQFAKNFRQMTDWLAQGRYAMCFGCKDSMRAKNQGLPVDDFDTTRWKEGSSFSSGGGSPKLSEPGAASQCGESFYQLVSVAQRTNRAAKIGRRGRPAQFAAHRYPERRRSAGQSIIAGRQIFRCRQTGIRGFEAHRRSSQGNHRAN